MPPDLPDTYYLDNVQTLFDHVSRVYSDLLGAEQLAFLDTFDALGDDARKLHIRLLNRSHELFRESRLNYREIADLGNAVDELDAAGCIAVDPEIEPAALLALYTRAELLALLRDRREFERLRRAEIEALLLERADDEYFDRLRQQDRVLQLLQQDHYQLCQMLFFGNLNQSMTDFVLRDLGLHQYEPYPVDSAHRPYRSRLEILQHWTIYQLETLFALDAGDDPAALVELFGLIPDDIDADAPAFRRSERLRLEIARQLERLGEAGTALELYRQCRLPPGRERTARILAGANEPEAALDLCLQMIEQPLTEEEIQFASMFAVRLGARHRLEVPPAAASRRITHQPEIVDLVLDYADSVELAVAACYDADDGPGCCRYLENSLFTGVLGLLLWDVIFAPVRGAFYHPFQHRPSDFHAHDFCARRAHLLERVWRQADCNDSIWTIVQQRWQAKFGLMNPLVNWQALDLDIIRLALERIDHAHWRAVFERILGDLRNNRAGFPDLVHFPPEGGYCLIEVKGPGDSLQKNQRRWMQFFHEHGIPHRLARVTWKNA